MATKNASTLSHLRFIHTISHLDPPVNHSIFRTAAGAKFHLWHCHCAGFYEQHWVYITHYRLYIFNDYWDQF